MIVPVFGAPLWLLAGVLATLAPIVLHLVAPRPPARAPLPTARFVEPQARARRTLTRRPHDLPLLLLRCAFLLLLAAAMAAPRLVPGRSGTADIVLLDAAIASDSSAITRARAVAGAAAVVIPFEGGYARALRELPQLAAERTRADSVRAWWLTAPRWGAWLPGTSTLRAQAWPAAMGLIPATHPAARAAAPAAPAGSAAVVAGAGAGDDVRAALVALGHDARTVRTPAEAAGAALVIVLDDVDDERLTSLARAGATVLLGGNANGIARTLAADGILLRDAAGTSIAAPAGADVVAAWSDGGTAALARAEGAGCIVHTGIDLARTATAAPAEFPALLDRLPGACAPSTDPVADLPLDAAGRAWLAGGAAAAPVDVRALSVEAGLPIGRWFLVAALAMALLEWARSARRARGTRAARTGTAPP
ncbi:MAG TPA: BatA domain-containing protein [Albitalea sp.]